MVGRLEAVVSIPSLENIGNSTGRDKTKTDREENLKTFSEMEDENLFATLTPGENTKSENHNEVSHEKSSIRKDIIDEQVSQKLNESQLKTDLKVKIIRS